MDLPTAKCVRCQRRGVVMKALRKVGGFKPRTRPCNICAACVVGLVVMSRPGDQQPGDRFIEGWNVASLVQAAERLSDSNSR